MTAFILHRTQYAALLCRDVQPDLVGNGVRCTRRSDYGLTDSEVGLFYRFSNS
jgi:hypothetical protein